MENSSTALLSAQPDSIDQESSSLSFEELIELSLEEFGFKQLIQSLLVSLPLFFDAQQTLITVFTDTQPPWHCTTAICNSSSTSNICELPTSSWAWDGPSRQSIISEWSLQCSTSLVAGLPATSFFLGCFLGGLALATLGDSNLGRKNLLFFSALAMSVSATATALATNVWVYSAVRFVTGCFRASIMTSALVLLMEMVGKRHRGLVTMIAFLGFSLGILSLPAVAYLNRGFSWRLIYVWTSIPSILYALIGYFLVCESPRWLFLQHGRRAEAMAALKMLSNIAISHTHSTNITHHDQELQLPNKSVDLYSSIKNLLARRWALQRLWQMMALAFGVGMVYYGLLLGVKNLSFNTYLSVTFNGLLDIPAYLLTFVLIQRWNRKTSILGFCVLSGLSSLICAAVSGGHGRGKLLQLGAELVAVFSVCVAFNVLLIYTTELFPTSVRNSATSMVRQAIMLGALLSPVMISCGRAVCYAVFGVVVVGSGLFVICLPETRGMTLCDSLDEQEEKENIICNSK